MNLLRPSCRTCLSADDFSFIQAALSHSTEDGVALKALLLDPDVLNSILDQPDLYESIKERSLTLNISAQLYFYVLVRRTLLDSGIDDRNFSDYIASLLVSFSRTDNPKYLFPGLQEPLHYLVDIVTQIEKSDYYHRFFLYAHLGNQTLFLSGLFPNHIRHKENRRAAPGLRYYESMGRSHFKAARNHPLAREFAMEDLYDDLYQTFHDTRKALNKLSESLL